MDLLSPAILALPEIALLILLCTVLCVDVFISKNKRYMSYILTQIGLVIIMCIAFWQYKTYSQTLILFAGHYRIDKLAIIAKLFMYLFSFFSFAYAYRYITDRAIPRGDYYLLGIC